MAGDAGIDIYLNKPFSEDEFLSLMRLARGGVEQLVALQKSAIG
jgi:ribonuclease PH